MFTLTHEFNPTTRNHVCFHCNSDLRKESPTGREPHEWAIDTGVDIEFEGTLALCESCVIEMASLLGMVTQNDHESAVLAAHFDTAWEAAHRHAAELAAAEVNGALEAIRKFHLMPVAPGGAEANSTAASKKTVKA